MFSYTFKFTLLYYSEDVSKLLFCNEKLIKILCRQHFEHWYIVLTVLRLLWLKIHDFYVLLILFIHNKFKSYNKFIGKDKRIIFGVNSVGGTIIK